MDQNTVKRNLLKAGEYLSNAINANCDRLSDGFKGNKMLGKRLRALDAELEDIMDEFFDE